MELAKITMRGQITIPAEIRKKLGVRDGDKVIFLEENGRIIMENAAMISLKNDAGRFCGRSRTAGFENRAGRCKPGKGCAPRNMGEKPCAS